MKRLQPSRTAAQEVEGAGDVEVADIDVPVLVRLQGLHEAGAFLGGRGRVPGQQSRGLEDAIDAGRAAGDDVGIEHHEGQPAIAFQRVLAGEVADALLLVVGQPVVARHPGVVLVDLAEALLPVVELAGADADPGQEAADGDARSCRPRRGRNRRSRRGCRGGPSSPSGFPKLFF